MAAIHFESSLDNSKLIAGVNQANKTVDQFVNNVQNQGTKIDNTFRNMAASAGAYFSLQFGANLVKEIISVRGEFQQLGIAFETMLNSKEKADRLMNEAVKFAQKTPFTLTDVATNIKQLMAMGIAVDDVMLTMKSLGDVAAGVSVPISRVAINYGQVAVLGKLQAREVRDFAMAGIPLTEELAKNMGKTKDEIAEMVTAGTVGFKDVEKAFQTMSGEGGKFFNLMEKQNASVTGQISNLTDKWQVMLNEIGKSNEGLIYGGISGIASIISSYEEIINILKVIVATYGAYRAALIAVSIAQSYQTAAAAAQIFTMTGVLSKLTFAQYASARAQAVLNGVMAINPYVAAAMALSAIGTALYLFTTHVSDAEKAQIQLNESMNEEKVKIDTLVSTIKNVNAAKADQIKAEKELNKLMPEGTLYLNAQSLATETGTTAIRKYIESVRNKMEIDKLNQDLVKNLNEQDRIARGEFTFGERVGNLFDTEGGGMTQGGTDFEAVKSAKIFALKEEAEAIAKRTQEIISGVNAEKESGKVELTVAQQIINATNSKKEAESQLNEMRKAGSKATKKAIEEQIATIDEYKKALAILTGTDDKTAKKAKEDAELENRIKATEEAMKSASGQELDNLATKLVGLEKELELRKQIVESAIEAAKHPDEVGMPTDKIIEKRKNELKASNDLLMQMQMADYVPEKGSNATVDIALLKNKIAEQVKDYETLANMAMMESKMGAMMAMMEQKKYDALQEVRQKDIDNLKKHADNTISIMSDGLEKEQSLIENSYQDTLDSIEKSKKEYLKKLNESKGILPVLASGMANSDYITILPADVQKSFDQLAIDALELKNKKTLEITKKDAFDKLNFLEEIEKQKNAIQAGGVGREQKLEKLNFDTWVKYQKQRIEILKNSKDSKDQQEAKLIEGDIDVKTLEQKIKLQDKYYQQGLQFLDNMIQKYGEQLGMTEEQAGLISSLAKGDYFAAAFNMFGIISDMFKESKENISDFYTNLNDQTKKLIESIDLINESLSNVGAGASLKSFNLLSSELLKLKNDAARLNEQLIIIADSDKRRGSTSQGIGIIGDRDDGEVRTRTILDLAKQTADLYAEIEKLTVKLLNPNLGEDQRTAIVALLNSYNDILNSIEQSIESITGTTIDDLSRSLTDAFLSGEDAAIKWGQTVNDIIKNVIAKQLTSELLTKPITEAINTLIGDTSERLTPTEAQKFKDTIDALYTSVAPAYKEAIDALNKVGIDISGTGKDNKNTLTGQIKGISEDTASMINGRLMKINVDMDKSYFLGMDQLDVMTGSAANLLKIEKNTFNTVQQLIVSNGELVKMNATLNAKL